MHYSSPGEIEALFGKFELKLLPKDQLTHEAHLTVGLHYLYHHDFFEALCLMKAAIITYNEAVGTPNSGDSGYHETLTAFWLRVLEKFLKGRREESLLALCNDFLSNPSAAKDLPLRYYDRERLFSVEARATWIGKGGLPA